MRKSRIPTSCALCGKKFEVIPSKYKEGRNYCSLDCSGQVRKRPYEVPLEGLDLEASKWLARSWA